MTPRIRSLTGALALLTGFSLPSLGYQNHEDHEKQPANMDEKYRAGNFVSYSDLSTDQKRLIKNYFNFIGASSLLTTDAEFSNIFQNWCLQRDWMAAEFLVMTRVMTQTYLKIGTRETQLITIAQELKEVKGDRLYFVFDQVVFKDWLAGKQGFHMKLATGRDEIGTMHMGGNQWGGSLHKGFDIQGFTSNSDLPRLQINYLKDGSLADCDIDAYPPFLGGMIPNPKHLTYQNSDSRYWLAKYIKKYGTPGFEVVQTNK